MIPTPQSAHWWHGNSHISEWYSAELKRFTNYLKNLWYLHAACTISGIGRKCGCRRSQPLSSMAARLHTSSSRPLNMSRKQESHVYGWSVGIRRLRCNRFKKLTSKYKFQDIKQIIETETSAEHEGHRLTIQWLSCHTCIRGNDEADKLTNSAHTGSWIEVPQFTDSDIKGYMSNITAAS